ncbi:hypothetical protein D3C76_781630 [compost metagenome]
MQAEAQQVAFMAAQARHVEALFAAVAIAVELLFQAQLQEQFEGLGEVVGQGAIQHAARLQLRQPGQGAALLQPFAQGQGTAAVDDGEDAAALHVEVRVEGLQLAEEGQRGIELQGRHGDAAEPALTVFGETAQVLAQRLEQLTVAGHRPGIGEDRQAQQLLRSALQLDLQQFALPVGNRLAPFGAAGHHPARARRIAELQQRRGEALHQSQSLLLRQVVGEDQGVVLVGLQQLLAAPFAAHHQQTAAAAQLWRNLHLEQPFEQLVVEGADQLHDEAQADAVAAQGGDQAVQGFRGAAQFAFGLGAGDAHRQHMGMGGEQAEHLGQVQQADHFALLAHGDALDAQAGHQDHRVEEEIAQFDAGQRTVRQRADGLLLGAAVAEVRGHQVGTGDDTHLAIDAYQQGISATAELESCGIAERETGIHLERRQQVLAGDAGEDEFGQVLTVALGELALAGEVGLEEAGEPGVARAQLVEGAGGELVDDALLHRLVTVLAAAGEQPADVEQVVGAVLGEQPPVLAAFLDHALEQDEQAGHRGAGFQQDFAVGVVADAERIAQLFALVGAQLVERR